MPSVTFTTTPNPGTAPWRCPYCNRPTVTCYRCSNGTCGKDLTQDTLQRIGRAIEHEMGAEP